MTIEHEADVIVQTVFRNEGKGSLQCPCSHPEVAISLTNNDYGRCHLMTIEHEADVIVQTVFRNEGKGSLQCPCSHPEVAISLNNNDFKI